MSTKLCSPAKMSIHALAGTSEPAMAIIFFLSRHCGSPPETVGIHEPYEPYPQDQNGKRANQQQDAYSSSVAPIFTTRAFSRASLPGEGIAGPSMENELRGGSTQSSAGSPPMRSLVMLCACNGFYFKRSSIRIGLTLSAVCADFTATSTLHGGECKIDAPTDPFNQRASVP